MIVPGAGDVRVHLRLQLFGAIDPPPLYSQHLYGHEEATAWRHFLRRRPAAPSAAAWRRLRVDRRSRRRRLLKRVRLRGHSRNVAWVQGIDTHVV